jgi:release factor glutamine methyltransferase
MTGMVTASGTTIREALASHCALRTVSDSPLLDCQLILAHVLGVSRSWLYAHPDDRLDPEAGSRFDALVAERRQGVPIAYITGRRSFHDMDLEVSRATLVPRPETELLVDTLLERLDPGRQTVVDAGTGSGAVALALAIERPCWRVYGTDVSRGALEVAARNAARFSNGRVTLIQGNWLDGFATRSLDAIVCNPPYIPDGDAHLFALRHEPYIALAAGSDGLDSIRTVIAASIDCLRPGGLLVMEHGFDQQDAVYRIAECAGYVHIEIRHDLNDLPRVLIARSPR